MSCDLLTLSTSAPTAYEDTVRVCVACSAQLKAMDTELSNFTSQLRGATATGDTLSPTSQETRTDMPRSSPRVIPSGRSSPRRSVLKRTSPRTEQTRAEDIGQCQACFLRPIQQSCNSCGLEFCRKCTVEVKKFLLGATSKCTHTHTHAHAHTRIHMHTLA